MYVDTSKSTSNQDEDHTNPLLHSNIINIGSIGNQENHEQYENSEVLQETGKFVNPLLEDESSIDIGRSRYPKKLENLQVDAQMPRYKNRGHKKANHRVNKSVIEGSLGGNAPGVDFGNKRKTSQSFYAQPQSLNRSRIDKLIRKNLRKKKEKDTMRVMEQLMIREEEIMKRVELDKMNQIVRNTNGKSLRKKRNNNSLESKNPIKKETLVKIQQIGDDQKK